MDDLIMAMHFMARIYKAGWERCIRHIKKENAVLYEGVFMSSGDKHQVTQAGQ